MARKGKSATPPSGTTRPVWGRTKARWPRREREEAGRSSSRLGRIAREPLVHFILAGLALFGAFSLLDPDVDEGDFRIELTEGDLWQMAAAWLAQGRAAPTPEQLRRLADERVREEVLYREALALGLDERDTIVRRRLAQKMEFLAEEAAVVPEPTAAQLLAWYRDHPERFALPGRVTFRHAYFSPDRRGTGARADADRALARLARVAAREADPSAAADRFMFQSDYADRSAEDVASIFGRSFAQALFELVPGRWSGPIESGYGWHLVRVDDVTPARVPDFSVVQSEVRADWVSERRADARREIFAKLRARYEVVLPERPLFPEVASR